MQCHELCLECAPSVPQLAARFAKRSPGKAHGEDGIPAACSRAAPLQAAGLAQPVMLRAVWRL
eukprot:3646290-Lingulodinium_polyedra.AAC.1